MKLHLTLCTLILSVAMCSQAQANGCFLGRLLNRGGCGCPTSCCDAPTACDRGFQLNTDCCVRAPRLRGLRGCGCDTGCDSGCGNAVVARGCGCDRPAANCCDTGCGGGLLSGFGGFNFGRRGCCQPANDCCDPCARASIFDNFRGRLACRQPRCCEPRCRPTRQICINVPNFGLIDRLRSCGCGCDAPAACDNGCGNTCGCDNACGRARPVRARFTDCGCGCDPAANGSSHGGEGNGSVDPTEGNGAQLNRGNTTNSNYIIRGTNFAK